VSGSDDGIHRTRLASERTLLAWWRTGFTLFALGVAVGRLVPELSSTTTWPYEAIGVAYALVGVVFLWIGHRRAREVERALDRGEFVPFHGGMAIGVVLATR
jgi:putative membrane protein